MVYGSGTGGNVGGQRTLGFRSQASNMVVLKVIRGTLGTDSPDKLNTVHSSRIDKKR